jgi:hypothetical protein
MSVAARKCLTSRCLETVLVHYLSCGGFVVTALHAKIYSKHISFQDPILSEFTVMPVSQVCVPAMPLILIAGT